MAQETQKDWLDKTKAAVQNTSVYQGAVSVANGLSNWWSSATDFPKSDGPFAVAEIGKPFKFTESVDQYERTHRFLLTRMNAVDIYPCNYAQQFFQSNGSGPKQVRFKYGINYQHALKEYQDMCKNYLGEANAPSALRIFLTDDTVVADSITTQYQPNFFQSMADKLSGVAQNFTNMQASMNSSRYKTLVDSALSNIKGERVAEYAMSALSGVGLGDKTKNAIGGIVDTLVAGASVILKGNKLALPKIWQTSNYTPNFSVSTKLFSPYGSPKAIKENIIKPLTYILLMASPRTDDMTSYGRPFACTVRAWGASFLSLAGITGITLQRGGQDSVYNIYKQPLVINVNIQFGSLVDGMLAFSSLDRQVEIPVYEKDSYKTSDQVLQLDAKNQTIDGSVLPTVVPTVGGIIRSFQPVAFAGVNTGYFF